MYTHYIYIYIYICIHIILSISCISCIVCIYAYMDNGYKSIGGVGERGVPEPRHVREVALEAAVRQAAAHLFPEVSKQQRFCKFVKKKIVLKPSLT